MKTFKNLLSEIAEPQAGDEINFKKKHIIQRFYDPAGNDDAFTGNVSTEWDMIDGKRFYNHADYRDGEDEDVYEDVNENTMPNNIVHALADRHAAAATHHKNKGNYKGYAAHAKVSNDLFDAALRAGSHMPVRTARLEKQSDKAWREHPMPVRKQVSESDQLDELSASKLKSYMKAASDDAAKSDDAKKVAKRTDGVLKASEKIKEAHSHPLYDMHGLEDEDINNDGIVDEKDAAIKRARNLLTKKRYYLEDVADDTTHIKNHGTKKKYAKTNSVLAPTHKVKQIVEDEELNEISINLKQKYYDKSKDAKRASGYGYDGHDADGKFKGDNHPDHKRANNRWKHMKKVQDDLYNHKNPIQAKVHDLTHMKDDGDVYDHTQTSEEIKDGDVLKLHGGRAGVMVKAWPVVTHGDSEHLHKVKEGSHISTMDKGRYKKSFEVASKHAKVPELKESVNDLDEDGAAYAIGMSKAKEIHKDEPPLRKKTIETAHKIAKSILGEEEINEISKKTLSSYIKKASHDAIEKSTESDRYHAYAGDPLSSDKRSNHFYQKGIKAGKKMDNRLDGIKRAANKLAESDENCNCYHVAGSEDSHHIENLKSLAPNSRIVDGIAKVSREDEEAIAYMDKHFPSLHEDVDQLDELSKSTLGSYIKKAQNSASYNRAKGSGYQNNTIDPNLNSKIKKRSADLARKHYDKYGKRATGIDMAVDKLTKESYDGLDEAMNLDKVNQVHHDEASADFAKKYVKAHKGDYKPGGSSVADEKAQEQFYTDHDYKHIRAGFGGSGETHYKDAKTGAVYSVRRTANGKGFHGTDHLITKVSKGVNESEQLDELSRDTLGRYAKKALNYGDHAARMSHSDDDEMGKIATKRLTGVKKAVDRIASKRGDATRVKTNIDKARKSARNRYTDKSDQGKAYDAAQKGIAKMRESLELDEAFSAGSLKLSDGSSVTVSAKDAKLLNQMFNDLNPMNKKKMENVLMTDKHGFQEILGFAREAL